MPDDHHDKQVVDKMRLNNPFVRARKMFGYPAYYVGKTMAIYHYVGGVGLKLPYEQAQQLLDHDPNVTHIQPHGRRKMCEWVQITLEDSQGYDQYQSGCDGSIKDILSLNP